MTDPAHVHALVFGLGRYDYGSDMDLPGSARDAVRFARWVLDNGVAAEQVWVGLSGQDEQEPESALPEGVRTVGTTRDAVRRVFTEELTKHQGELLLVFWSGHGIVTTDRDRVLFTSDMSSTSRWNVAVENLLTHLASTAVNFARTIVIIDACANFAWSVPLKGKLPTETWDLADERSGSQDQDVLLAAAQGQTAAPNHTERYGEFANAVLDALAPPDAPPVGLPPDLDAVWLTVQAAMKTLRESGRTRQTPLRFVRQHNRDLLYSATVGGDTAPSRLGQGSPAKQSIVRLIRDYGVFVGRETQLVELDRFVTDDTARQLLIWEPTGQGKTALLIHWVRMLEQRDDLTVLFLPISHRAKTDTIEVALPHLAIGLAEVHGERPDRQDLTRPDTLRLIIQELLGRSPETRLVVVIDGLDETTGWELDARLFPARLPERVKIVAAANATAQTTREQLLRRLGWQHEPTANISPLAGLTDRDIADMLARRKIASDTPALDELTEGVARVSQRDPLAVRMITDDLAHGDITADQLDTLPTGLKAYFEHSLQDIKGRSADSDAVAAIMGLCATAHGPLTAEDLAALDPDRLGRGTVQGAAIREVGRYLFGDRDDGYTPQHPYLGQLYLDSDALLDRERTELQERFVTWGTDRLAASIDDVPDYLIRFWITHLAETGRWTTICEVCLDPDPKTPGCRPRWAAAQHHATGNYAGYIADLDLLLSHARKCEDLVTACRCTIALAAVHSTATSLPPKLPALLVAHGTTQGRWSMATALAHVQSIPHASGRAQALVHLAPLAEPTATQQLLAAAVSIDEPGPKADALSGLAKALSGQQLEEALAAAVNINDPWAKADALSGLAETMDAEQLERALATARSIDDPEARARALTLLVDRLENPRLVVDEALAAARNSDTPWVKVYALSRLVKWMDAEQLEQALAAARSIDDPGAKARALSQFADQLENPRLVVDEALAAARSSDNPWVKAWALSGLAKELDAPQLDQALAAALSIHDPSAQAEALSGLATRLDAPQLEQALAAARSIGDPEAKAEALSGLAANQLVDPRQTLDEALAATRSIGDPWARAWALSELVARLDAPQLEQALAAARSIDDPAAKAEALSGLAGRLEDPRQTVGEALTAARSIDDPWAQVKALNGLADQLEDPQRFLGEALAVARGIDDPSAKADALSGLAKRLDAPQLERALAVALSISEPGPKAHALNGLAERLDAQQLERALAATLSIDDAQTKAWALRGLAERLDAPQLDRALAAALSIDDPWVKADALYGLAERLNAAQVKEALAAALSIDHSGAKADALRGLAKRLDAPQVEQALAAARSIDNPEAKARALSGLAEQLEDPRNAHDEALAAARSIEGPWAKAQALTGLAGQLEDPRRALEEALAAAVSIDNPRLRAWALSGLAERLDAPQLERALAAALSIDDPWVKADALSGLAERLDAPQLERAFAAALSIDDSGAQARALSGVAERLDAPQLERAFAAALSIDNPGAKAEALGGVAERLDAPQLERAFAAALSIDDPGAKARVLTRVAAQLEEPQLAYRTAMAALNDSIRESAASPFSSPVDLTVLESLRQHIGSMEVTELLSVAAAQGNTVLWQAVASLASWFGEVATQQETRAISEALTQLAACRWST
jgi:hypothetical protein